MKNILKQLNGLELLAYDYDDIIIKSDEITVKCELIINIYDSLSLKIVDIDGDIEPYIDTTFGVQYEKFLPLHFKNNMVEFPLDILDNQEAMDEYAIMILDGFTDATHEDDLLAMIMQEF